MSREDEEEEGGRRTLHGLMMKALVGTSHSEQVPRITGTRPTAVADGVALKDVPGKRNVRWRTQGYGSGQSGAWGAGDRQGVLEWPLASWSDETLDDGRALYQTAYGPAAHVPCGWGCTHAAPAGGGCTQSAGPRGRRPGATEGWALGSWRGVCVPALSTSAAAEAGWPNEEPGPLQLPLLPVGAVGAARGLRPGGSAVLHAVGALLVGLVLWVWPRAEGVVGGGAAWHCGESTAGAWDLETHTWCVSALGTVRWRMTPDWADRVWEGPSSWHCPASQD